RLVRERADGLHGRRDGVSVRTDLVLRVPVQTQPQEVEEVVEVALPVHLGVQRKRQVYARQLPGDVVVEQRLVLVVRTRLPGGEQLEHALLQLRRDLTYVPALPVDLALEP